MKKFVLQCWVKIFGNISAKKSPVLKQTPSVSLNPKPKGVP